MFLKVVNTVTDTNFDVHILCSRFEVAEVFLV